MTNMLLSVVLLITVAVQGASAIEATPAAPAPYHGFGFGAMFCALADGRILVAGGNYKDEQLGFTDVREAYLYDLATDTWTQTGSLVHGNAFFNGILLDDGRVLTGPGTLRSEIYDPATGLWVEAGNPSPAAGYCSETLCRLPDGRVLAAGLGFPATWIFDPQADTWAQTGSLSQDMRYKAMAPLADGRVLITGGEDAGSSRRTELFDPATGVWSLAQDMNTLRVGAASIRLPNGRILVSQGYSADLEKDSYEIYDPATNSWSLPASPAPASKPSWDIGRSGKAPMLVVLPCGKVLGNSGIYDPVADRCTPLPSGLARGTYPFLVGGDRVLWTSDVGPTTLWSLKPTVANVTMVAHRDAAVMIQGSADALGAISSWSVVSGPSHGTLVGTGPLWTYLPQAGFIGDDAFTYVVTDATYGTSLPGVVTIHMVNSAPVAHDVAAAFNEGTSYSGNLLAEDADGDSLAWSVVAPPAHGMLTVTDPLTGAFTYIPAPGDFTDAVFRFSVTDRAATATATVTLHINRVNHQPSCVAGRDIAVSDAPTPFTANAWVSSFSAGSPYESGQQVLRYVVTTDHPEAFFLPPALSRTGTLTFIPAGNLSATIVATMAITVQDDGGTDFGGVDAGAPVTATITMTPATTHATTPAASSSGGRSCGAGAGIAALALFAMMIGMTRRTRH